MARNPVVLVIDDEIQIQRLLKLGLGEGNFKVVAARNAAEARELLASLTPDVVVLDLGLPDRSGFDVLQEIRQKSTVPVIVLSVREGEADKVRAFELGADDYVTKPFGMAELVARLRVALKHRFHIEGTQPVLRLGDLEIDLVNRRVMRAGQEVNLTRTEYEILGVLASHPGKVLTHDFILRNVRGGENVGDPQYLRVYVRSLRNKLGDRSPANRVIRTEMGVGYRLVVPNTEAVAAQVRTG
jgi:two-component system, OmpR family, KDP operon response regulator KdpE